MSEKEQKIMDTFGRVVPRLTEHERDLLLVFGEGVALMVERRQGGGAQASA